MPHDYFRYTVACARNLAERSGLRVELAENDGGFLAVFSNLIGIGAKVWPKESLLTVDNSSKPKHYLSTRMLARKPS